MRALLAWLVPALVLLGGYAVVTDRARTGEPRQVLVVVDSSFAMVEVWDRVPARLDALEGERYTEYALATEKNVVHSWRDDLALGAVSPFAPCDFTGAAGYPEAADADRVVVLTTAGSCAAADVPAGWEIVEL